MTDWEAQLDARLRQVPLPPGLLARLQSIGASDPSLSDAEMAILSDDALDEQLCAVEVPANLVAHVERDLAALAIVERIDVQLNRVVVPRSLMAELRQIPWQLTRRKQVMRMAQAAALFLSVGVSYFATVGAFLSTFQPQPPENLAWIELDESPVMLESGWLDMIPTTPVTAIDLPDDSLVADPPDGPSDDVDLEQLVGPVAPPPSRNVVKLPTGPMHEVQAQFATGRAWDDVLVLRWGVLGSPSDVSDRLPPLETLLRPLRAGFEPPLVRGYDRKFLLTHGVHPIVLPEAHADLQRVDLPLSTSTDSYRLAWQRLREGRWPDADEMHIADFMAAMDYSLPEAKDGEVALRVAAGPSPFGKDGARLLQIAAVAGKLPDATRSPTHITVALDVSASMNLGGKLDAARQSVRQLLKEIGPRDRVSLLLFNDRDQSEIVAVGKDDAPELARLLESLTGAGGTNLAAGIQRGASLAMSETDVPGAQRKLVLVTDGRAPLPAATHRALVSLLNGLKREGLTWSVIDLSAGDAPDEDLARLSRDAGGKLQRAADAQSAQWLLAEELLAKSAKIGSGISLRVSFDPKAVAAYRLIGHEPTRLAGLSASEATVELRSGEAATSLLEVWLKPNVHGEIGVAELTWHDAGSRGREHKATQRITRLLFAPTFAEAALSLQAAAIAAETGEVLKQSPFAETRARGLADVQSLAGKMNSRLREREGFQRFVELVDAAEKLRVQKVAPK